MTTTFGFRKLFFGFLILLLAGFFWLTMQTCQKADTDLDLTSETATDAPGKIADTAAGLKRKTQEMANEAAKSAGGMIDNATDKSGDVAGKATDRAGEAYLAAGDMAVKAADRAGKAWLSADGPVDKAGDAAEKAILSTRTSQKIDGVSGAEVTAEARRVEVAARYQAEDLARARPPEIKSPAVTAAGTWFYEGLQFDFNQSDLKPSAFAALKALAATLKIRPELNIEIHGHTDSRGARAYNLGLSLRRAQSVAAYLAAQGIAASRMTIKGFGPDRPIYSNASEEGFNGNRRVEIKPIN